MTIETTKNTENKPFITVTEKAVKHMKKQLGDEQDKSIRLSVKKSGCTGFAYVLDTVVDGEATDRTINIDDALTIFVANDAALMLVGTEIDLKVEGLNRELQFNNPNVTDMCGCGSSFSVN